VDTGTTSSFVSEMEDVGKNERAALKYSSLEAPPGRIKNPEKQSPYGRQLLKGQKVEREHTGTIRWLKKNPDAPVDTATRSIASDHLDEDPMYYDHLHEMESKYKRAQVTAFFDELQKIAFEMGQLKALGPALHVMHPTEAARSIGAAIHPAHLADTGTAVRKTLGRVKPRIAPGSAGLAPHLRGGEDVLTSAGVF
jgi:hypothetical protein